ncbi:hypothetical protein TI10_04795 [Photorhabdus luminescens subsp. luminescens]|uniref:Uncharacterized protein n=2 Tax=Photorhabdus luminescens TaxID=29488 RepID=A0A1G5QAA2_PHOLU|nr:hypothetical protein TI10_04795 [Photorhabdus luminescens subsp. luminescens]TDB53423.1 hypothetical protein C5468_06985 [Photorhabdus luminescens subsp. mexicana]SCZ58430.1 hypothetical protein SAMN02982990_01227 [Photorhabdus luminescens]
MKYKNIINNTKIKLYDIYLIIFLMLMINYFPNKKYGLHFQHLIIIEKYQLILIFFELKNLID